MTTVKDLKEGKALEGKPVYLDKPVVLLNKEGVVLEAEALDVIIATAGVTSYYDDCTVKYRTHDLAHCDNTKIPPKKTSNMKGLTVYVLRNRLGDCTLNGISSKYDTLTLIGAGIEGPFEPTEDRPAVTMITRTIGGETYKHLVPCDENAKPLPGWWMAGGNFAETSDSRFPNRYPLSIHDRQEH